VGHRRPPLGIQARIAGVQRSSAGAAGSGLSADRSPPPMIVANRSTTPNALSTANVVTLGLFVQIASGHDESASSASSASGIQVVLSLPPGVPSSSYSHTWRASRARSRRAPGERDLSGSTPTTQWFHWATLRSLLTTREGNARNCCRRTDAARVAESDTNKPHASRIATVRNFPA